MEMTNWKTIHKHESWGNRNFGIEIRVSIDRELNENDSHSVYSIADQIEEAIMRESLRLDPEVQKNKAEEREKLLACFPLIERIFAEEIPNGYSQSWHYSQSPWFRVTTTKGIITLGWRKHVIAIDWESRVNGKAEDLFPGEDVTKFMNSIYAWGYDKAKAYISRLLSS